MRHDVTRYTVTRESIHTCALQALFLRDLHIYTNVQENALTLQLIIHGTIFSLESRGYIVELF